MNTYLYTSTKDTAIWRPGLQRFQKYIFIQWRWFVLFFLHQDSSSQRASKVKKVLGAVKQIAMKKITLTKEATDFVLSRLNPHVCV